MDGPVAIRVRDLQKAFPTHRGLASAVRGIDFEVADGEFLVLLGPSGCGKTTTLRCIAGLERPERGSIEIGGLVVDSEAEGVYVPPERRNIGMVFQSYAVWPHLTVFENIALPLIEGRYRIPKGQVRARVLEALNLVRLEDLETRPVTDLSGGQQQRVALARAIVTRPKVLLMDEPLSNLDARLREQMRLELKKITKSIGVTALYVTHDQSEALSLGDRVCVMNAGEILQIGTPREVYARPGNLFVAQFVGEMNFVCGIVVAAGQVHSPLGTIACPLPSTGESGNEVILAIRPEHLSLLHLKDRHVGAAEGRILSKNYLGDAALFEVEVSGVTLRVKVPGDLDLAAGDQAAVLFAPDQWRVYPAALSPEGRGPHQKR